MIIFPVKLDNYSQKYRIGKDVPNKSMHPFESIFQIVDNIFRILQAHIHP